MGSAMEHAFACMLLACGAACAGDTEAIHWGRSKTRAIYSPWDNVIADLGAPSRCVTFRRATALPPSVAMLLPR